MDKDQTLTLPGGAEVPFRVVRPDDAPALQRLHARCGERTIYLRFFGPMEKLSDEQARYFASTDGVDHLGLVALDPQDPEEIIAVVRYARQPGDGSTAGLKDRAGDFCRAADDGPLRCSLYGLSSALRQSAPAQRSSADSCLLKDALEPSYALSSCLDASS
jgi:hypothetical protein